MGFPPPRTPILAPATLLSVVFRSPIALSLYLPPLLPPPITLFLSVRRRTKVTVQRQTIVSIAPDIIMETIQSPYDFRDKYSYIFLLLFFFFGINENDAGPSWSAVSLRRYG